MKVYNYIQGKMPFGIQSKKRAVIALGFFDGVHKGHRVLLERAREEADKRGSILSVFTFRAESLSQKGNALLYSTQDKLKIFERIGIDEVIVADFADVANLSPEEFTRITLIDELGCICAVAGFDFRFGRGASGDMKSLENLLSHFGRDTVTVEEQRMGGEKISTTRIKALLSDGKAEEANLLLGEPYFIHEKVTEGLGLGHRMGIPTVNFAQDEKTPLKRGVYRTGVKINNRYYNAVTNIGTCPTFGERKIHAETNIIDYDGTLYGEDVTVFFLGYLREEKRFESEKELIMQINVDKSRAITENGADELWQEIGQS